jgi:predicted PurR-regulated permease PerM
MERIILTLGIAGVDILISLLFGLLATALLWFVHNMYRRFGFGTGLCSLLIGILICPAILVVLEVGAKEASVNLSERATSVVSHVNVAELTSVGNCRYVRTTTVWLVDGVIVRKVRADSTATCTPTQGETK